MVTHPFHALRGRELEILFRKRRSGGVVYVCAREGARQVTLPEAWTDRGPAAQSERLSVEGLAALAALAHALRAGGPGAG